MYLEFRHEKLKILIKITKNDTNMDNKTEEFTKLVEFLKEEYGSNVAICDGCGGCGLTANCKKCKRCDGVYCKACVWNNMRSNIENVCVHCEYAS